MPSYEPFIVGMPDADTQSDRIADAILAHTSVVLYKEMLLELIGNTKWKCNPLCYVAPSGFVLVFKTQTDLEQFEDFYRDRYYPFELTLLVEETI